MFKRLDSFILWNVLQNVDLSESVGCDEIAVALDRAGVKTRRGNKFTARVVRACLSEMCEIGVADVEARNGAFFIRLLNKVDDDAAADAADDDGRKTEGREIYNNGGTQDDKTKEQQGKKGKKRREAGSVSVSVPVFVGQTVNNNTKEYKKINKKSARQSRAAFGNQGNTGNTPSVVDAVKGVDVEDDDAVETRRKIVAIVWEPSLRKDLIDRAVVAIKRGFATLADMIESARRAASIASKSAGVKRIWQTFALDVKRAFDSAGYVWEPTKQGAEPKPSAKRVVRWEFERDDEEENDARLFVDADGRSWVCV